MAELVAERPSSPSIGLQWQPSRVPIQRTMQNGRVVVLVHVSAPWAHPDWTLISGARVLNDTKNPSREIALDITLTGPETKIGFIAIDQMGIESFETLRVLAPGWNQLGKELQDLNTVPRFSLLRFQANAVGGAQLVTSGMSFSGQAGWDPFFRLTRFLWLRPYVGFSVYRTNDSGLFFPAFEYQGFVEFRLPKDIGIALGGGGQTWINVYGTFAEASLVFSKDLPTKTIAPLSWVRAVLIGATVGFIPGDTLVSGKLGLEIGK
ncbi:MAG: hypothetical protein ACXWP5_15305 [Bdellovibrionota bacterium]